MTDSRTPLVAGPSNENNNDSVPPPDTVKPDASFSTEQLRVRLSPKRSLFRLRKKRRVSSDSTEPDKHKSLSSDEVPPEDALDMPFVQLGNTVVYSTELEEDYSKDIYRWAILYENQRGYVHLTNYVSRPTIFPTA